MPEQQVDVLIIGAGLAGYVWDQRNPCVDRPEQVIELLCQNCTSTA